MVYYIEASGLYYALSEDGNGCDEHGLVPAERADVFRTREDAERCIEKIRPSLPGFEFQIVSPPSA